MSIQEKYSIFRKLCSIAVTKIAIWYQKANSNLNANNHDLRVRIAQQFRYHVTMVKFNLIKITIRSSIIFCGDLFRIKCNYSQEDEPLVNLLSRNRLIISSVKFN